ncbi:DnaD domain protein [Fundicoccus culcitae]|uniref:DnaD domain protein n=1 Tax=Fundicoccus culcitae TaxID=2969821 RepID=A0ABY5P6Y7_9LACT|nr:DnaD domain protein [Fundicoccus culcitae]UUX34168.1 DnaD domain protein [Fundicoccus culcitae]
MKLKPNDQFHVLFHAHLSPSEEESLYKLYQPIIGSVAVSLFQSLMRIAPNKNEWSAITMHASVLPIINIGIDQFEENRFKLEAVGLLKSYKKIQNQLDNHQILFYELIQPLTPKAFFNHPLLSTNLFHQLGEDIYYKMVETYTKDEWDKSAYQEVSKTYADVFRVYQLQPQQDVASNKETEQNISIQMPKTFNYSVFLRYLIAEGIEHTQLTSQLKESVAAIHQIYHLNEEEMVEVVKACVDIKDHSVQLSRLKVVAAKKKEQQSSSKKTNRSNGTNQSNDKAQREQQIQAAYPSLSKEDIALVILCEQIPNSIFLNKLKQSVGGFATDSEHFYVNSLHEKSSLNTDVINMLVYYLLVFKQKDSVFKGELERTANSWQKQGLDTASKVLMAIYAEDDSTQQKPDYNQTSKAKSTWKNKDHRRVETLPDWLIEQEKTQASPKQTSLNALEGEPKEASNEREQTIRNKLNQLLKQGGE